MNISVRSSMTAGVAAITAVAITFAPSAPEPTPHPSTTSTVRVASPPVQLTAAVQPLALPTALPNLLVDWVQRVVVPPSASAPFPTPQFPPVVAPTSIGSSIIWIYNAVEPWVRYGFDLAAYAVGWIPYVGWLAPQITIFYNFGERIARSITYNIAFWLDGDIGFTQGLINVGIDTINSFIFLANDQLAFWLPPLPPIPPIGPFAAEAESAELKMTASVEESTPPAGTETDEAGATDEDEVVDESEGDQVESLGEDIAEEEEVTDEEDLSEVVVTTEDSGAEATDPELTPTDQDADGTAEEGADGAEGDAAEGEIGENSETADTADPTTDDNTAETGDAESAEGDSAAE